MNIIKKIYEKHYKKLLVIPIVLLILAFVQITVQGISTGDFINKGVSLKGGLSITIEKNADVAVLQDKLDSKFSGADIHVRALSEAGIQVGTIVEATGVESDKLIDELSSEMELEKEEYSIEIMGSSLGESFFQETVKAMLIAFIFMGIVVFFYFRTVVPSFAVILAAFSDIVVTMSIVNLMGMRLSTAGIAAFLMLIGYSVDTDILLTTRLLKRRQGTVMERVYGAMKTGLTMNITTMTAILVALFLAQSDVIKQIMIILLIGLIVDMINTWIQNVGILRIYLGKKGVKDES
ncbi:protein translocase subunit SecF [Candidatus Woesearchaeota archaeon]|nr:protein translocase subunit SecF [Candidatus Woesearchaeota archaeon]